VNESSVNVSRRPLAIVAGYGPVGRTVEEKLRQSGFDAVIVDLNPNTIRKQSSLDRPVVYGSCADGEVLRKAGIERADALILAIPDEDAAIEACRVARSLNPRIFIAARTSFLSRGMLASQVGADAVVVEEVVTAEAMQRAVVEHFLEQRDGDGGHEAPAKSTE